MLLSVRNFIYSYNFAVYALSFTGPTTKFLKSVVVTWKWKQV